MMFNVSDCMLECFYCMLHPIARALTARNFFIVSLCRRITTKISSATALPQAKIGKH